MRQDYDTFRNPNSAISVTVSRNARYLIVPVMPGQIAGYRVIDLTTGEAVTHELFTNVRAAQDYADSLPSTPAPPF